MSVARLQYTGATNAPYLTNGETYEAVAIAPNASAGPGAMVAIVADSGELYTVNPAASGWSIADLYVPKKVI